MKAGRALWVVALLGAGCVEMPMLADPPKAPPAAAAPPAVKAPVHAVMPEEIDEHNGREKAKALESEIDQDGSRDVNGPH